MFAWGRTKLFYYNTPSTFHSTLPNSLRSQEMKSLYPCYCCKLQFLVTHMVHVQVSGHECEPLNGPNTQGSVQTPSCLVFPPSTTPRKYCHGIDLAYKVVSYQTQMLKLSPWLIFGQTAVDRQAKYMICCTSPSCLCSFAVKMLTETRAALLYGFFLPDF